MKPSFVEEGEKTYPMLKVILQKAEVLSKWRKWKGSQTLAD